MRLFTAIPLSDAERDRLVSVQRRFARNSGFRMTKSENLHLTLRFFGEWPDDRLEELSDALGTVERPNAAFAVSTSGLRFLPNSDNPRIFIALAEAGKPILALQRGLEECARGLGMAPETRPFVPHVTLGRSRDARQAKRFARQVRELELDLGSIEGSGYALMASVLTAEGSQYSTLRRWRFE